MKMSCRVDLKSRELDYEMLTHFTVWLDLKLVYNGIFAIFETNIMQLKVSFHSLR